MLLENIDRWQAEMREQATAQGIEQGIEQGVEQGIEQGIEQARLEDIRKVLELRFGAAAVAAVAAHLEAAGGDLPRLTQLHQAAVQAPDLDAFRRVAENEG